MRKTILILSVITTLNSYAQTQIGLRQSNYGGINSVITKPASGFDLPYSWDLNLGATGVFIENQFVFFNDATIPTLIRKRDNTYFDNPKSLPADIKPKPANALVYSYYDNSKKTNFIVSSIITGPSFLWSGKKYSAGIFINGRSHINGRNIDQDLDFYSLDAWKDNESKTIDAINITMMNWLEIGVNFAKQIEVGDNKIALGINAKYLMGYDAIFINSTDKTYVNRLPHATEINNTVFNFGYTNNIDQNNEYTLNRNGRGLGLDLGFNYKQSSNDERPYIFKTSANVVDLGYIFFNKNTFDHSFNITNATTLDKDILKDVETIVEASDTLSTYIIGTAKGSLIDNAFNMNLPTGFLIDFDYSITPNVFINAKIERPIVLNSHTLQRAKTFSIAPRFESKWFEFGLPLVLYNDQKARLGTWLKLGYLTIGSDHILSWLSKRKELSGTDIYFALKIIPLNLKGNSGSKRNNHRRKRGGFGTNKGGCYTF